MYAGAASIALQRKIAEDSLKESREIFSSVAKYAPVPLAIIDPNGRYQFINQKFVEIFGYDLNDFKTGKEWFTLAYSGLQLTAKKSLLHGNQILRLRDMDSRRPETFTVHCKDGVDRVIIFRPVTLSDNKQCIVYEDITGQRAVNRSKTSFLEL